MELVEDEKEKMKRQIQVENKRKMYLKYEKEKKEKELKDLSWYPTVYILAGYDYLSMEFYEKAIKSFDKAYELGIDFTMYANFKSLALTYLGEYEQALDLINKGIEKNPNLSGLYNTKAFILYKIGDCENAIKTMEKALKFEKERDILHTNYEILSYLCY